MQLILSIDVESGIKKNMSSVEETILKGENLQDIAIKDIIGNETSVETIDENNTLSNFNAMESKTESVINLDMLFDGAEENQINETDINEKRSNEDELKNISTENENTELQDVDDDCNETEISECPILESSDVSNKSSDSQDDDTLVGYQTDDFDIDLVQNVSPAHSVVSLGSPRKENEPEDKNCVQNISAESLVQNLKTVSEENNEIHESKDTNIVQNIITANSVHNIEIICKENERELNSIPTAISNKILQTASRENEPDYTSVINLETSDVDQTLEDAQESNERKEISESIPTHDSNDNIDVERKKIINVIKENDMCVDSEHKKVDENLETETKNPDISPTSETDIGDVNTCNNLTIDKSSDKAEINLKSHRTVDDTSIRNVKASEDKEKVLTNVEHKLEPKKKLNLISKLSNTLDILSDDEDENTPKTESQNPEPEPLNKQCINLEDDDDIMLIDDECITKDNKMEMDNGTAHECKSETTEYSEGTLNKGLAQESIDNKVKDVIDNDTGSVILESETKVQEKEVLKEPLKQSKENLKNSPLLSPDFLKTFKKSLADATREDLEEFCILKIVESVFNKSNLGEIKSQLKVMSQTVEEYKNKAKMLTKQNRDLQVVLKSVQEELKKNTGAPITPLKITRSVGMQVLMTDKNSRKRQSLPTNQILQNPNLANQTGNNTNIKNQNKGQNTRSLKPQQQIPVPRLVPAVNNGPKCTTNTQPQAQNNSVKLPPVTTNTPNGVKIGPAVKPEKRTHSKMQQNNSITVDLTDDEPPSKVLNRNFNAPVRCVPPQNLLAPQRPPHPQPLNSPRKVYIPISGPQGQNIKPGQTIMLKSLPAGSRPRGPSPNLKLPPSSNPVRMNRVPLRHPAPLPDSMKQYQPPNWKAIPPAPELKLAKVENGIVISWKIDEYRDDYYEEIASYQLYAYQETSSPPNTSLWKKIGDVKALPLPMACTLTQFMAGYKYYFAVRAIDVKSRIGPFSLPGSILLLNKI